MFNRWLPWRCLCLVYSWPDEGVACEVSRVCKEAGRRVVNKPLLSTQPLALFDTVSRLVLAGREIRGR